MSELTPNLELFKYDVTNDATTSFSITNALNNNWDILDNAYTNIMSSNQMLSANGYIKFNSGFLINWGQTSTGTQEVNWVSPSNLTTDGTLGGNDFAVYSSAVYGSDYAWKAFDGVDTGTSYWETRATEKWIGIYNPLPIKVSLVTFLCYGSNTTYSATNMSIQGSNDNIDFITLTSSLDAGPAKNQNLTVSTNNFYKYYRIYMSGVSYPCYREIHFYGTYLSTASNQLYFPCSFSNTNYAYSLAYLNGVQGDSCATALTKSYITLRNNSNATTVKGIAVGY